ncbi:MAG: DUF1080 domain-containing protein, partial [Planctomycetes bacterium]|nr:DUF1080 domain-containing protein [Planctomycetota bacterium]
MKNHSVLIVALAMFGLGTMFGPRPAVAAGADEWGALFNGKDLAGWDGDPRLWSVKDGVIHGETTPENPTKGNTFLVYRGGEFDDFELNLKFRLLSGN